MSPLPRTDMVPRPDDGNGWERFLDSHGSGWFDLCLLLLRIQLSRPSQDL